APQPGAPQPGAPQPPGGPAAGQPAAGQAGAPAAAPAEEAKPAAPVIKLDKYNDAHSIPRLKRPAISWIKLAGIWILFLIWVLSADWINRDSQLTTMGYGKWNPIIFFPFLIVLVLFAFPIFIGMTNFWVAFGLLFVAYLATYIPYVVIRNK